MSSEKLPVGCIILNRFITGLFLVLESIIELEWHCFSGDGDGVEATGMLDPGGESVKVNRFLGLVLVGSRSLVTELGGVCHPILLLP